MTTELSELDKKFKKNLKKHLQSFTSVWLKCFII